MKSTVSRPGRLTSYPGSLPKIQRWTMTALIADATTGGRLASE